MKECSMGWEGIPQELLRLRNIPSLLKFLRNGELELVEYLDILESQFQAVEPQVLSFLPEEGRFERLREEAKGLYQSYPTPDSRPPLFGLLIGVKDIFHVEGFPTHAGSQLPPEAITGPEARCVTQLKQAGVLVFGKTVTTEFAYFAPGPTRNPYNPGHTPGGSSSGSAAAVAAGLVPFAFGTQTIGSISRPASFCGVVGFKPSYDRISRSGVIPLAPSVDHIGFFTSDTSSIQLPAKVLCKDWKDSEPPQKKPVLGVPTGPYLEKASKEMLAHFNRLCEKIQSSVFELKQVDAMPDFEELVYRHNVIVAAEAFQIHEKWFAQYGDLFHPKTSELIQRGKLISSGELNQARQGREKLRRELTALMDEHDIDLWLSPGAPGPAPEGLDSTGDPVMNLPWTHSGLPTLCLPGGLNEKGLPLGLQVAGRWYADEALLQWGIELETLLDHL
jgi:Asp-tRNA(Asn)/Glu-tRNA(Gln) amidotransferase A subunit family amidase